MPAVHILVAGASGLIGREVVRMATAARYTVRTLSRDPAKAAALAAAGCEVRVADATRPDALDGLCDGIDVVVSAMGAPVSSRSHERRPFSGVDLQANLALLREAERAQVRRFVYIGVHTDKAYAGAKYIRAHTAVENALRQSRLEHAFIRPTGVFGSLAEIVELARRGAVPIVGAGDAQTNPIHESDVADVVLDAVDGHASQELDLGGPEILTRRAIAELAFAALGARPRTIAVPPWVMHAAARIYGLANPRMGEFLDFIAQVSTHATVAPVTGRRTLSSYFGDVARRLNTT